MTFDDVSRTMTSYQIDMQFTELEPLTESDYLSNSDDSTGPLANPDEVDFSPAIPNNHIGY